MTRTQRSTAAPGWMAVCIVGALLLAGCDTTTTGHVGGACTPADLDDFRFTFTNGGALFHQSIANETFSIEFEHLDGPDADPNNQQFEVNYGGGSRVDGKVTLTTAPGTGETSLTMSEMYAQGPHGGPSGGLPIDVTYTVTWPRCTFDSDEITVTVGTLTVTSETRVPK